MKNIIKLASIFAFVTVQGKGLQRSVYTPYVITDETGVEQTVYETQSDFVKGAP